jgi:TolB-like protein/tetratricopeptide (TPR) repeat protein
MDVLSRIVAWLSDHEAAISAIAAMIVIAGVVFAGFRWLVSRRSRPTKVPTAEEDPLLALPTGPVVAVLPFENLSRDPDQEYFSDGLTDDIITALSRFKDLFVIARNSTFRYKGQPVDVRQLNRELGARYVLEGSVQRAESRLRVTTQLLDARDGTHLWAETYDRDLSASNVFDVQDEITEQVVGTIASGHGVISRERLAEIREKPTDHLDAYECVLRVGAFARDRLSPTEHAKVRDALERAVKLDPGYAEAWACLCQIYLFERLLDFNPRPNPLDRASEAARRAVDLDSTSQLAHWALATVHFHRHDLDAFSAEAERAIALNPNRSSLLAHVGQMLYQAGDDRGIALVRKAMMLDPFHPTWMYFPIAAHHFYRGEYEEALVAARKIDIPDNFFTQIYLAVSYAELGRKSEAQSAVAELRRLNPDLTIERHVERMREMNVPDDRIQHMAAALRKAGLPE